MMQNSPSTSSSSSSVPRSHRRHTRAHHTNDYENAKKYSSDQVTDADTTTAVATPYLERSTKSLLCPFCSTSPTYPGSR